MASWLQSNVHSVVLFSSFWSFGTFFIYYEKEFCFITCMDIYIPFIIGRDSTKPEQTRIVCYSLSRLFTHRSFYSDSLTELPPHIIDKPWISRKNDKTVKIMIKTQILLWKTMKGNRRLRVRVRFLLFYSELAPTDPWCNMLQTLLGWKKKMRRQC